MERRRAIRISGGYDAEIIYEGKTYAGVIENLSENGACVIILPTSISVDFSPGAALKIKFQPHPQETLIINCKVEWSKKIPPHGLKNRMGVEIIDPPWDKSEYFL